MIRQKWHFPEDNSVQSTRLPLGLTNEGGIPEGFSKEVVYEDKLQGIDEMTTER